MNPADKPTRRDFLSGKAALDAVSGALNPPETEGSAPKPEVLPPTYLIQVGRRAMACDFEVFFNAGQYPGDTAAALEALDVVDAVEDQLTVYRDDSEVAALNRAAAEQAVPVDEALFELLELCHTLYEQTGGAFDVTAGPLSKVWGFFRREGTIPTEADLAAARENVGSPLVELESNGQTVRFRKPGVELNFGAIGKGYALDLAAARLIDEEIGDFLLHGGQSSVLARGHRAAGAPGFGWQVGIGHPLRRGKRLANIYLSNRGLGTSGSGTQFFRHGGRRYGHILDPRTGWPAEGLLSVTATAPTATSADALATAFYVMGAEKTREYCDSHAEVAVLLVRAGKGGTAVEVETIGFEEGEFELLPEPVE